MVAGAKRVNFYSAPNEACMQKDVFVVNGDSLTAYSSVGKWLELAYVTKSGGMVQGWVMNEHLKVTGTMGPVQN